MKKYIRIGVMLSFSMLLMMIDVMSKKWAESVLAPLGSMPLVRGIIGLRYAENTGAAFSAFSNSTMLLSVVSAIICAGVLIYMLRHPQCDWMAGSSLAMILSGGIGNLLDRMTRGYVVDFFELQFVEFAVFNVADICITAGAVLLFIALLRGGEEHGRMAD